MGVMIDGRWHAEEPREEEFLRQPTVFRNWITADGDAGPTGRGGFRAEPGRYHLYISYACPWAHRTLIFRRLKGLESMIGLSVVHWFMGEEGWTFEPGEGVIPDTVNGTTRLHELYARADPLYSGKVTVPVLWDKATGTIVNNESADIIRMFNAAFDGVGAAAGDFYPEPLREAIEAVNARVYDTVNNGVYKAGFARSQRAYERAVGPLFDSLDWLEERLGHQRYLCGDRLTEADWRLWTTLIRFDSVYVGHFKCNRRRLVDYPRLWAFTRELYQMPGITETVRLDHIKRHYYQSHDWINPSRVVPVGPDIDFTVPHGR